MESLTRLRIPHYQGSPKPKDAVVFAVQYLYNQPSHTGSNKELTQYALTMWMKGGGQNTLRKGQSFWDDVRAQLAKLVADGLLSYDEYGLYWLTPEGVLEVGPYLEDLIDREAIPPYEAQLDELVDDLNSNEGVAAYQRPSALDSTLTLGTGSEFVYVIYYSAYKELAELRGKSNWECKIGQTTDITGRLSSLSSSQTASPYKPVVALLVKHDRSRELEGFLHNTLRALGRDLPESEKSGSEWFLTSPEEIESLYQVAIKYV